MLNRIFKILTILFFITVKIFSQVTFTSSNLPVIIINTNGQKIPDEPKITADMGIIDNGSGRRNNITDSFNGYNGKIGIEIRGHSTQMFPKKQYGIELRDNDGNDIKASLLGMPEESDWVLNASYTDKSFMRNVIAYKLTNDLGKYASRTRFCEVILNGEYIGIYILQEKIKRDKNRVNIKKMNTTDISGNAVTGGYIVKIDRIDHGDKYWTSLYPAVYQSSKAPITYIHEYPKSANIVSEQQKYIKEYVDKFETSLYQGTYRDPFLGYYDFIDLDSFINVFLINEFTKNTDAYRLSAFFYKDRDSEGGKLCMGPIWDYDICFGLADYDDGFNPAGWQAYKHYDGIWSSPFWTSNLMNDLVFKNRLAKKWVEAKNKSINIYSISKFIEENAASLEEALQRNFAKWKDLFNPNIYIWPNKNRFTSYGEEKNYLESWISQRIYWLNGNLPSDYSDVEWLTLDLSKLNFIIGKATKIPLSNFVKSKTNVSFINFVSPDANCKLQVLNDTLSITLLKANNYVLKGVGVKESDIVVISPAYNIPITATDINQNSTQTPYTFELFQNYPNPFNGETTISYQLASPSAYRSGLSAFSFITLKIYDLIGREVTTLVNEFKPAGIYAVTFNTQNLKLPSGIYYYKLQIGNSFQVKKMILQK